jgi:hypothetical protein
MIAPSVRSASRAYAGKLVWICGVLCVAVWMPSAAWAHAPHDEIRSVVLSPAFHVDRVMFAIARELLMRSLDGGLSWHRLALGLGRGRLSALTISSSFTSDATVFAGDTDGVVYVSCDG